MLRGLPPLAKLYVLRLLPLEVPVGESLINSWPTRGGLPRHREATQKLQRLKLLVVGSSLRCADYPGILRWCLAETLHLLYAGMVRRHCSCSRISGNDWKQQFPVEGMRTSIYDHFF